MKRPTLWVITGPTAVGKTALTVAFAKQQNIPIISCDSRQFYKELSIGTAKPTTEEMDGVPHFFINSHTLNQPLSAASFEQEATPVINDLLTKHGSAVLTGGSGLYLQAILDGIDEMPEVPDAISASIQHTLEKEGLVALVEELKAKDPDFAASADLQNSRRVVRALEVIRASGKPFSSWRKAASVERPWQAEVIVLHRDRNELYQRIERRVDLMMEQGLVAEAQSVVSFRDEPVLRTVGYQELFPYFDGEYDLKRAIELIKRNSRRYAKRQLTWFRRMSNANWMTPKEFSKKYLNS